MDILTGQQQTYPLILKVCGIVFHEGTVTTVLKCSEDGINFRQMRIFHMWEGAEKNYLWNICMQPDRRLI